RVVSEGDPDLQRRYRSGAPRNMGASDFFHVAAAPRPRRNSATYLAAYAERARIRCLDRPKSSSDSLTEMRHKTLPFRRPLAHVVTTPVTRKRESMQQKSIGTAASLRGIFGQTLGPLRGPLAGLSLTHF